MGRTVYFSISYQSSNSSGPPVGRFSSLPLSGTNTTLSVKENRLSQRGGTLTRAREVIVHVTYLQGPENPLPTKQLLQVRTALMGTTLQTSMANYWHFLIQPSLAPHKVKERNKPEEVHCYTLSRPTRSAERRWLAVQMSPRVLFPLRDL